MFVNSGEIIQVLLRFTFQFIYIIIVHISNNEFPSKLFFVLKEGFVFVINVSIQFIFNFNANRIFY